jgi:SET domain-containing protein
VTLHSNVIVRSSAIHGLGVFTTRGIADGETILIVDDSRLVDAEHPLRPELGEYPYHCDYLAQGRIVLMPSRERHINSSCEPNTYVRWIGDKRCVVGRRALEQGEEITYDYFIDCHGGQPWECCCGSARCLRHIPGSVFDLPCDALCARLPYLSDWFVAEHAARIEQARRQCAGRIDSQQGDIP